ncbi:MAG TPA: T9SS type A sorting domain-containing protein [Flavobacteriaceae bacterium]|nr:T9SS type A sorting domain-containing protein [Flavobacteriaceae bacterium]
MKKTILTLSLAFVSTFAIGQTMTISHTGIATTPSSTDRSLSVNVGDDITFVYGGGGTHPMTEGWQDGSTSTPVPFVTQTVTSSIPTVTFQINTAGIYKFHCGASPGNSNNWGTIYVADGTTSVETVDNNPISVFPNPARNILIVKGLSESAAIYALNGKKVMYVSNGTFNVSDLSKGTYIIKTAKHNTIFIKK